MKKYICSLLFVVSLIFVTNCTDNDDKASSTPIQNFIWKGLNQYYLYQPQIPNLADNKFDSQLSLDGFLKGFNKPETLFESLIFDRQNTDKYSVLFPNYIQLEQLLQGTSESNGIEFGLTFKSGSTTAIFGWVKYIMPNTDAATKPIERGTIFYAINGTPLTVENRRSLLGLDTYTLNLADYDGGNITPNGQSVTVTKNPYSENPVFYTNTYTIGARKVGYLVYNGFYSSYEDQLNNAIANLKSQNITDLVLDLRYNSGGSVATATRLGSMITGQFNNQLFAKNQWSPKMQAIISQEDINNNFTNTTNSGATISNLNLSKVYILTSRSTASASELIINCLKPYITVVQVGAKTTGKNVGSVTLYDSPNFRKQNANPSHTYAMQPIVIKVVNKNGFGEYTQGISPKNATNELSENLGNLSQLGNTNELLLAKVLNIISLGGRSFNNNKSSNDIELIDNNSRNLDFEMHVELK